MDIVDQAILLHRAGRLAEAEELYRQMLATDPDQAQALQLLGLIACQRGDLDSAVDLITRALAREPANAEFHINLGEVQRRQGRYAEAIATIGQAVALAPRNAFAHYNLAVACTAAGRPEDAIAAYLRAVDLQPGLAEAWSNLGLLWHEAKEDRQAVACLQRAGALRPGHGETENNLGLALWSLQEYAEALAAFTRATELKPQFAGAHANRAQALRKLGRGVEAVAAFQTAAGLNDASADIQRELALALMEVGSVEQAVVAARRAVELEPEQAEAHHALGVVLAAANRSDSARYPLAPAIAAYERALAIRRAAEWEFELAVLRGITPATAPDAYVRTLFDAYAPRFENHLVQGLNYRVPEQLRAAVREIWQSQNTVPRDLDILDLGSGTGRVGEFFRPHARSLTGVDLAPNMIALAEKRRDAAGRPVYDRLMVSHILPALGQFARAFDLILAADVFIYVGSLDEVLPAAAGALRPGGLLAFSLERFDPPTPDAGGFDFHLRFRHSLAYIRTLSHAAGLVELSVVATALRNDVPPGWLVVLQRPAEF